jgi:hypothetical protein
MIHMTCKEQKFLMLFQSMKQLVPQTIPDGFLKITPSTADFAVITGSLFAGKGSPDGVFC